MIEEITNGCSVCTSLKQLPKEVMTESTQLNETFGTNFSADVIRMHGQKILLTREKLSQFSFAKLIDSESSESLREALLCSILEFIPSSGTDVQVDCATGWQSLKSECLED